MATTLNVNEIYQLPSPPLSPSNKCPSEVSPSYECSSDIDPSDACSDEAFFEQFLNSEQFIYSEEDIKRIESIINSPVEYPFHLSKEEMLRNKYMNRMDEGVEMNGEIDAVQLRVYETGKDYYEDFMVHPMFLSLHSYQFFKLFEEIKEENEQDGVIEIEVPDLKAFSFVLYFIYTGDNDKFNEIAEFNKTFYKGVVENIKYL
eukprot:jgi/Orpsp1_1/1192591/evm.model.d7180000094477.1